MGHDNEVKRTPLYDLHLRSGARMVEFAGWEMPLSYTDIVQEHLNVRQKAGIFDLSHMGEIEVWGKDGLKIIQNLTTNDASLLDVGGVQYTLMLYPDGGVVDDLLVYRLEDHYMLVVNAANTLKDLEWIRAHAAGDIEIRDVSTDTALIAIQGPLSQGILSEIVSADLSAVRYYHCIRTTINVPRETFSKDEVKCIISRTGYTGEDGFEIYIDGHYAEGLWETLMRAGGSLGLMPAGLGARDSLRIEAAYPLYGHEISGSTIPYEAGLGWVVKLDKGEFMGRESLAAAKEKGLSRRLVGIQLMERGVPRAGCEIMKDSVKIGHLTSGTFSPSLQIGIGMGYVDIGKAQLGNEVYVMIRNKAVGAKIVKMPFVKHNVRR